jgi:hypothetical protein
MRNNNIITTDWDYALSLLPGDLEESCRAKLAIVRQREILSAEDLLRLCMAYGFCGMSLRQTAAWAATVGVAQISNVAVLKRVSKSADWLGSLVEDKLFEKAKAVSPGGREIRIVDGSSLSGPGSKGTDWRVHLEVDPVRQNISHVQITEAGKGESFKNYSILPDALYLGDRGYSSRSGILSVLRRGGHVLCRAQFRQLGLKTQAGRSLDVLPLLETVSRHELGDWRVSVSDGRSLRPLRLIAIRKTRQAEEKELKRLKTIASRKGKTVSAFSRKLAGFVCVVTDLDAEALDASEALELYRARWQVELMFKRLKSLIHLGDLRAKSPSLARAIIFAKILGALLVEDLSERALSFFPWGFRLSRAPREPLAYLRALDRCP